MKAIISNYSFNATAKTITLTDFSASRPVLLERLALIVDTTLGVVLYNLADGTAATATISSNNIITLTTVGSAANGDKLAVFYDTLPGDPQSVSLNGGYQANVTVLSTELNSLVQNGNSSAGTAFDNSATRYPLADIQISIAAQGSARSLGAVVALYMVTRTDGANFDSALVDTGELITTLGLDNTTTARRGSVRRVSLPPEQMQFFLRNSSGQALAASGSTVILRPYFDRTI